MGSLTMAYCLESLCGPNVFPDFLYLSLAVGLSEIFLPPTPSLQLLLSQILNTCVLMGQPSALVFLRR